MDPHLEELTDESIHPVVDHEYRAVCRIEHGKVKHSSEKVVMLAEDLRPVFEGARPLFLILPERVFAFEYEFQLIIAVILITKDAHHIDVELVKMSEVRVVVFLDLNGHGIHHAQRIGAEQVFDFHEVDEVLEQSRFKG